MKKFKVVVILVCTICLVLTYGCTVEKSDEITDNNTEFSNEPIFTSIVHGSPNGLWFMLSSGIAESLGRSYEGSLMEIAPGENTANFKRLSEHSIDFALTLTNTVYTGYNGIDTFNEPLNEVGGIAVFYPSMLQFILKEDSGVTTLEDFILNKVPLTLSIGVKGGSAYNSFELVLLKYDLTLEDLEDWGCRFFTKSIKETSELFADGVLDGLWVVAGAPTPAVVQMGLNKDMVMISFPDELLELLEENHGYSKYTFPAGSYAFEDNDFVTACVYTMITASSEVSDEIAYKVTKSINENTEYLSEIHSALKGLNPEKLLEGMPIPLHPGAERYYREAGFMD